nr:protein-tyrosine phosphatase family protein [Morganella morganii]
MLQERSSQPPAVPPHPVFMQPPSYPAPVPPSLQARARMPLPGEVVHQSLAQRRAGPKFTPFTEEMKTERAGDVFGQLQTKTAERLDRNNFITGMNHQRYGDIDTCATTQLFTPEGKGLPANQMKVDGVNLAMRSQYPKPEELRDHLCMLADQKPGVLVVLSSDNDIADRHLPAYFRRDGHYDDVSVKCKINPKAHIAMAGNLELRNYRIEITANGKTTPISVMHVTNWEDRTTIAPSALKKLVSGINGKIEQKIGQDPGCNPQPFIHCSAGIGRTGAAAGAIEILKPGNKNMPEEIVLQLRETGSSKMVQTSEQYNTLINLHKEHH